MHGPKRTAVLLPLFIAIIIVGISPQLSLAQFIPCSIVNLKLTPPALAQSGQPFQVTTTITISCDPSILPVIRVDLVDATTSRTISTTALPYYPPTSSFTVSLVNQATAPDYLGTWALRIQVYVISGINGQAVASTSQLFQISIQPYTPQVTTTQAAEEEATSITSNIPSTVSSFTTSTASPNTLTQTEQTTQVTSYPSAVTNDLTAQFAPIALIVVAAIVIIAVLVFAVRKPAVKEVAVSKYCGQCGARLDENVKFCTSCGVKQI